MSFGAEVRRRLQLAAAGCAVVLVTLLVLVAVEAPFLLEADRWIGEPIAGLAADNAWLESLAHVVAQVTRPIWLNIVAVGVAMLLVVRGFRRPAAWLVVVMTGCWATTLLLKWLVGRERPDYALDSLPDGSFPSGHSATIACAAGVTLVLATLFVRRRSQRRLVVGLVTSVAFVVGMDRLLLGVHWPSDVVAGFALGALWVLVAAAVADPTPRPASVEPMPSARPGTRRLAVILNPVKVDDPVAFRALVDRRAASSAGPSRCGSRRRSRIRAARWPTPRRWPTPSWSWSAAATAPCGPSAPSSPAPASPSGWSRPAPATCWPATWRCRSTSTPPSRWPSTARTAPSTSCAWPATASRWTSTSSSWPAWASTPRSWRAPTTRSRPRSAGWPTWSPACRHLMFPAVRVDISIDDEPFTRHRARTIVVGNVGFLQAGLPLLPDASIDDGRVDVVLVNPARFLSWLRVVVRIVGRRKKVDGTVNRMTGRKVVIKAAHDTPRQIDGDAIGAGTELICECLPGRLLVRVPR